MSLVTQRVFHSDNNILIDLSVAVGDPISSSTTLPFVASEDFVYIASDFPFNHRWIEIAVNNTSATEIGIDIWFDGQVNNPAGWKPAFDIIDQTAIGGVSFARSGLIQWTTDREEGWHRSLDSEDIEGFTEKGLYDRYWLRIKWSADLDITTAISYIGHKFSNDNEMYVHYPDLNNQDMIDAFNPSVPSATVTTWDQQHFAAAEEIIRDLRRDKIALSPNQLLDHELFRDAGIHKAAAIIFNGMGDAYSENMTASEKKYQKARDLGFLNVDLNRDGNLSRREMVQSTGFATR